MKQNFEFVKDKEQQKRFQKYALLTGTNEPIDSRQTKNLIKSMPVTTLENASQYFSVELFNLISKYRTMTDEFIDRQDYNTKTFRKMDTSLLFKNFSTTLGINPLSMR